MHSLLGFLFAVSSTKRKKVIRPHHQNGYFSILPVIMPYLLLNLGLSFLRLDKVSYIYVPLCFLQTYPCCINHHSGLVVNNNYHIGVGQIFRSGPGGTITASTTATYTVGVTSNVSASITTGQIVKASISAGFSNSTSSSRSTSYKYSRSISPGRYGNMQYGNYGAQVNVKKPPLSLHAMSKCSLLEAQSCPVRTYGVTDIGKARPL